MTDAINGGTKINQKNQGFLSNMPFLRLPQCVSLIKGCEPAPVRDHHQSVKKGHHELNVKTSQHVMGVTPSKSSSSPLDSTPPCMSPDSQFSSSEARSSEPYPSLYDEIVHLSIPVMQKLIQDMICNQVSSKFLVKCLLHYLENTKKSFPCKEEAQVSSAVNVAEALTLETLETVVDLLYQLEWDSMSCKSAFGLQRLAWNLNPSKSCRRKIEDMISFQLDKATLDDILIYRHYNKGGSIYDVNLILRLVRRFLAEQDHTTRKKGALRKIAKLMDKYLIEIAADPGLTADKFKAIAESLPETARQSHDDLYRALDIFLEAHPCIEEEETMKLCRIVNFQKLSVDAMRHVAESVHFPAKLTLHVLLKEQAQLKTILEYRQSMVTEEVLTPHQKNPIPETHQQNAVVNNLSTIAGISGSIGTSSKTCNDVFGKRSLYEQMALENPKGLDYFVILRQNEQLRMELQQMQLRVVELEKAYERMKSKTIRFTDRTTTFFQC